MKVKKKRNEQFFFLAALGPLALAFALVVGQGPLPLQSTGFRVRAQSLRQAGLVALRPVGP